MTQAKDSLPSENRAAGGKDATDDLEFRKVVGNFIRTKPKPHDAEKGLKAPKAKRVKLATRIRSQKIEG